VNEPNRPNPNPKDENPLASFVPTQPPVYEEFDISKFDFTIRDPGETPAPTPPPREEPPAPAKKTRSGRAPAPSPEPAEDLSSPAFSSEGWQGDRLSRLKVKARRYLRYALRPSGLYENISERFWWLFLLGACLFVGGFYLLVGMDWLHAGLISGGRTFAFVLTGCLVGGIGSLAFVGLSVLTAKLGREDAVSGLRMLSAVAGSAVLPSAVLLTGLIFGLFGLSVSLSFGVTALLWWIFSLAELLKNMFGPRYLLIVTQVTLWGFGIFSLITLTFSLK